LFRIVQSILKEQFPEIPKFRNVHQLDYATSGIFVLALNKKAAAAASKLFQERTVKKTYLALVNGHLSEDEYVNHNENINLKNEYINTTTKIFRRSAH
jgi:tRNA pseudouridine32 synthase/23S rRNA pseudouridine746 synthase